MKQLACLLIIALLVLSGCASHYYRVEGNTVHIRLRNPYAKVVYFASSLDGYKVQKAKKIDKKTWEVIVKADGEFRYFYIVDGATYLPSCKFKEQDDFGSENCIYNPDM